MTQHCYYSTVECYQPVIRGRLIVSSRVSLILDNSSSQCSRLPHTAGGLSVAYVAACTAEETESDKAKSVRKLRGK